MKAVILAAGKSSRFWPLNTQHKGLFKLMGKPLIFYTIENLKKAKIKELIVVQSPKRDIQKTFEKYKFQNLKIKYVVQEKPLGTGDALKKAEKYLSDKFLVLNGDDFYSVGDIKKCLSKPFCILLKRVQNPENFGQVLVKGNEVKKLVEKPKREVSNLVNTGLYVLPKKIFNFKIKKSERGEYELTDFIKQLIKKEKLYFEISKDWIPVSYPWDLLNVNEYFLSKIRKKILGFIEKKTTIKEKVIIGKNTIIKSGTYIEGPVYIGENCQIGPNCYIRKFTCVGSGCQIGQAVEIKNSIIGDNSQILHLSYIGDSIIGENCNLGAGTIAANLRLDSKTIKVQVKGKFIDTKRKKLGCVLGNDVKTGIHVSLMPGVLVGSGVQIGPHSILFENVKENFAYWTKFKNKMKNKKFST
jgi:bifunctional UDP-N-acetylglucosamine pyrophosphorylase/glucosamine-1-phosphate N-acetyltransferase